MSEEKMCPHCGSRETEVREGHYYCRNCGREFGRDKETNNGEPLKEKLTGLRFGIGNEKDGVLRIRIAKEAQTDEVVYEVYQAKNGFINKKADIMDTAVWNRLVNTLVDECFVCDWDRQYYPVNDGATLYQGVGWRLDLIVEGEDEITYQGIDAYPVYLARVRRLLAPYAAMVRK